MDALNKRAPDRSSTWGNRRIVTLTYTNFLTARSINEFPEASEVSWRVWAPPPRFAHKEERPFLRDPENLRATQDFLSPPVSAHPHALPRVGDVMNLKAAGQNERRRPQMGAVVQSG